MKKIIILSAILIVGLMAWVLFSLIEFGDPSGPQLANSSTQDGSTGGDDTPRQRHPKKTVDRHNQKERSADEGEKSSEATEEEIPISKPSGALTEGEADKTSSDEADAIIDKLTPKEADLLGKINRALRASFGGLKLESLKRVNINSLAAPAYTVAESLPSDEPFFGLSDKLRDHDDALRAVGPWILSVDDRSGANIFDAESGLFHGEIDLFSDSKSSESGLIAWDAERGLLRSISAKRESYRTFELLPDGSFFQATKDVKLSGTPLVFLPNGLKLIMHTTDDKLGILDLASGEMTQIESDQQLSVANKNNSGGGVALSRDGRTLALLANDTTIIIYDLPARKLIRTIDLKERADSDRPMAIVPETTSIYYFTKRQSLTAMSYTGSEAKPFASIRERLGKYSRLGVDASNQFIYVFGEDGRKTYAFKTDSLEAAFGKETFKALMYLGGITLSPDGKFLWYRDQKFRSSYINRADAKKPELDLEKNDRVDLMRALQPALAMSDDGTRVLSGDVLSEMRLWQIEEKQRLSTSASSRNRPRSVKFSEYRNQAHVALENGGALVGYRLDLTFVDGKQRLSATPDVSSVWQAFAGASENLPPLPNGGVQGVFAGLHVVFTPRELGKAAKVVIGNSVYREYQELQGNPEKPWLDMAVVDRRYLILMSAFDATVIASSGEVTVLEGRGDWHYSHQGQKLVLRDERTLSLVKLDGTLVARCIADAPLQNAALSRDGLSVCGLYEDSTLAIWKLDQSFLLSKDDKDGGKKEPKGKDSQKGRLKTNTPAAVVKD